MSNSKQNERSYDPYIFWFSAILIVGFVVWSVAFPTNMENVVNEVFSWMTTSWAWLWLLAAFLIVGAAFVMLFSSYGKMKLGKPDDEPEISKFSWFSMLFGAAIAAGIVFYGPAEPAYHFMTPPPFFGSQAETAAAANDAMTTSFFHWGLTPWAIYVMLTIPLAHACYTKDLPFRLSSAFYYVIGDRVRGFWGKVIDVIGVFATVGGLSTTTGLIALQFSSGLKYHYGMELPEYGIYLIIGALTAIFTIAVYTGVKKGIKFIGDVNMWLFIAVFFFVFIFGPTLFFLNLTTNAIGDYALNFIPMSLFTGGANEAALDWLGSWTVFYWAWWIAWAPFVALFIARISKGRTIRETIAATLLLPTLADFLWYGVVGGAGIKFDITGALSEHGLESAVFATIQHLPLTPLLAVAVLFLIAGFFLTSANGAAMALCMFVSGEEEPNKHIRVFWGVALGVIGAVLAATGSLSVIQTASIATAFPLMFLLIVLVFGTFRGLRKYRENELEA
jgi:glycine betaine transporter